jgi:20S proteasome alpha/beta subunit
VKIEFSGDPEGQNRLRVSRQGFWGFANHLARLPFREGQADDMSEEAAVELMHEALRVCYYRSTPYLDKGILILMRISELNGDLRRQWSLRVVTARVLGFRMVLRVDDMSEEAAVELMHEALRVCYYR